MSQQFWREQYAAAFMAVTAALIFWWGYGFVKGIIFGVAIMLLAQPGIWWGKRKR